MSVIGSISLALSALAVGLSIAAVVRRPPIININISQEEWNDEDEEEDLPMDDSIGKAPPLLTEKQWDSLNELRKDLGY